MVIKKLSHVWSIIVVFCLCDLAKASVVALYPDKENIQLSREVVVQEGEEKTTIVVGDASVGHAVFTGTARIMMTREHLRSKIRQGDIVIAPAIHSSWYAELSLAAAIVTEKNDTGNHALMLGKKLGIPVIVGASGATKKIIDGEIISLDPANKTVYHVGYSDSADQRVILAITSRRDNQDKADNNNADKPHASHVPFKQSDGVIDYYFHQTTAASHHSPAEYKESKPKRITQELYKKHFKRFKEYVLSMKTQLSVGKHLPRWVLKAKGCDDFAIDCMPLSFGFFFDGNDNDIVRVLESIGSDQYVHYIDLLIEKCSKKPGDLNWASRIAHEEHVKAINLSPEIKKDELIKDPKKYQKVDDEIKKENNGIKQEVKEAFIQEQNALVASGIFLRYWIQNKLPL